jgi:hypothetical protein
VGAESTFGYKASTYTALGGLSGSGIRATVFGSKATNAWVVNFSAKVGKAYSTNPTAHIAMAMYEADGSTTTDLVGQSNGTVAITATMVNAASGAVVSKKPLLPFKRHANQAYSLAIRADGNHFNFAMDASGARLAFDSGASFPDPLTPSSNNPNGRLGTWATEITNTAPKAPSGVLPAENSTTPDDTPTLEADFRDDEEVLPGYALGQGDVVSKYQFKILSEDGLTVLRDSTVLTASAPQKAARRVSWTVPTALPGGTYQAWCRVYDDFNTTSPIKTWLFTIAGGGVALPEVNPVDLSTDEANVAKTSAPGVKITWDHEDALGMKSYELRVVQQSTGAVIRTFSDTDHVVADGASWTLTGASLFPSPWAVLTRGEMYRFEARGVDADDIQTGWSSSPWFWVNSLPWTPTGLLPVTGTTVTAIPTLSFYASDADDDSSSLDPVLRVREFGGSYVEIVSGFSYLGSGRWSYLPSSSVVTHNDTWEWQVSAIDRHGEQGSFSSWVSFNLVDPPAITDIYPDDDDTVIVMNPTVIATVDRTVTSYLVRIYDTQGVEIATSGLIASSSISWEVPVGKLKNNTTYTMSLLVNTSDGLSTTVTTTWMVDYPDRQGVLGFVAQRAQGPFEPTPQQGSIVDISWEPLPETPGTTMAISFIMGTLDGESTSGDIVASSTGSFVTSETADPVIYGFGEGEFGEGGFGTGSFGDDDFGGS